MRVKNLTSPQSGRTLRRLNIEQIHKLDGPMKVKYPTIHKVDGPTKVKYLTNPQKWTNPTRVKNLTSPQEWTDPTRVKYIISPQSGWTQLGLNI